MARKYMEPSLWEKLEDFYFLVIEKTVCRWKGHKLVDQSVAGPETGEDSHYCERCRREWNTILY